MDRQASPVEAPPQAASQNTLEKASQSLFARIFSRHIFYLAILAALPIAFGEGLNASLNLLRDPDIWWHLADARLLMGTGHFIHTEPYSFSVAGQPWINPEWLAELPYWFGHQSLGLRGIYLVTWLAICANVLLLYWRGFRLTRSADAAFWSAGIGFVLMAVNVGPRTIALGYAALSIEMLILESAHRRRGLLWLLPPLFCVWVNLHGTWLIGMSLLVLYAIAGCLRVRMGAIEQDALERGQRRRLLAVLVACGLALFVNPYGWRLVWNPIDMMLNQKLNIANVAEWKPLNVSTLEGLVLVLAVVLMVLANLKRSRRWSVFELAVVLFGCYAAVDHVRFLYLAGVLIGPALAMDIARSFSPEPNQKTIPAMNALIAAAALAFIAFRFPSEQKLQTKLKGEFPLQEIRAIQPQWRTFDWDYFGGMMAFESRPSFIDSRVDTFEHHGVFRNYLAAMNLNDALEVLDHYNIDHALLAEGQPLTYLLRHTPGWTVQMREETDTGNVLLLARTGRAAPRSSSGEPSTSGP